MSSAPIDHDTVQTAGASRRGWLKASVASLGGLILAGCDQRRLDQLAAGRLAALGLCAARRLERGARIAGARRAGGA